MDEETEVVEIDPDTMGLAESLTLLIKHIKPNVDLGLTCEYIVYFLVHYMNEPIHPLEIEEYAQKILATKNKSKKPKH